ncbi:hypothetical protein [Streptomyces sp. NPDC127197]|uniref:hypothetical protein n=1 Tax=Streptomyces sp. NPDC127197 TaxID=3345388 RepID=UPI003625876A
MSGRSIATVTTEGQRRPADVALARVVDSSGKISARGLLVIDGHGRVAAKLDALCRFCQETDLPYDVLAFTTLPAQEQILILDHLGAAVRAARAALNKTDTSSGTVDFTVRHKGRDREVSIPARLALEAVNSWTTTVSVVIAGYREQDRADFSASITRRYESIHNDAASLPGGTGAARLAEQAVDQLADAGVLDAVPGYGRAIARYLKLPSDRPDGLELEYLALLAVWAKVAEMRPVPTPIPPERSAPLAAAMHRLMTLAMAAHACLTVLRARELDKEKAETDPFVAMGFM